MDWDLKKGDKKEYSHFEVGKLKERFRSGEKLNFHLLLFLQLFHEEAILRSVFRRIYSFDCFEGNPMPFLEIDEKLPEIVKQEAHFVRKLAGTFLMKDIKIFHKKNPAQ